MNKMIVGIIEDELPAARLLGHMLKEIRPGWEVITLPGNVEESVEWFAGHPHPDILFLDIHLADGDSFEFLEQARPSSLIIFTTAYDEYALKAFSVNSIDYLLKPIQRERLEDAIAKFENLSPPDKTPLFPHDQLRELISQFANPDKVFRTRFLISGGDKFFTLQVEDIAYFYSENKISFAVTKQNREHIIDLCLDKLKEQLDPDLFFRTNRQTIVNVNAIQRIEPWFQQKLVVHTHPPFRNRIIVSREKVSELKRWLNY